ncbi:MAG: hypothetical protein Q7V88_03670 [Actinomycetota bacterium]|nr:hypothetical protein [Actinomycetota bacterium]
MHDAHHDVHDNDDDDNDNDDDDNDDDDERTRTMDTDELREDHPTPTMPDGRHSASGSR